MSEDDRTKNAPPRRGLSIWARWRLRRQLRRASRPRVKKLRLALILIGLGGLALISTVFGMMMAVASDLPALENRAEYRSARNSVLLDVQRRPLGVLAGRDNRILVGETQISPAMKHAIIAIEDRRFFDNAGVDLRGIGRAFVADVLQQRAVQGASTITQQFVKLALQAQAKRTLFQKLREAALAYHLTRKWSKQKILTEYLNAIYFGNGAYGVESAARTYFAWAHPGCGTQANPCSAVLRPAEAALLAGVVQSPSGYDPLVHPRAAMTRRNVVLRNMLQQGYLTTADYQEAIDESLPTRGDVRPPEEKSLAPYFTTWVKQQIVDRFGAQRAFEGGLSIQTTLDLDLQRAARRAIGDYLSDPSGPQAALVAIDNRTGEVRAMVSGDDDRYAQRPFNLATQGQRQPGSAFKPFVLAAALERGISPGSLWPSRKREFVVPGTRGKELFVVNNYEGEYVGTSTLASALTRSDNAVFAAVGIHVGVGRVARLAQQMGIRTPVSRNYAITLGGLRQGVTVLDMAHAYETFAHRGELVTGRLAAANDGPVGVREVASGTGRHPKVIFRNGTVLRRVLPTRVADQVTEMMRTVVQYGTGHAANIGDFAAGKTGTTENYGDAWFVGFGRKYTVAVWVGHPDRLVPMKTEFRGGPVAGGTFPALIWRDFMLQAMAIDKARAERRSAQAAANEAQAQPQETTTDTTQTTTVETTTSPATPDTGTTGRGDGSGGDGGGGGKEPQPTPEPPAPAPKPTPQPQPTPPPQPPPGGSPGGVTPPSGGTSPPPTPGAGGDARSGKTPNANPGGD